MLTIEKKKWIIKQKEKDTISTQDIAYAQNISRRTVERLWKEYREKGIAALQCKQVGRPEVPLAMGVKQYIIDLRKDGHGIRRIEGLLKLKEIHVSHNKIHRLLRRMGKVTPEPKKARRKNYIRWERKHSNSLWQTDFCWVERLQCWLCAWLMIIADLFWLQDTLAMLQQKMCCVSLKRQCRNMAIQNKL